MNVGRFPGRLTRVGECGKRFPTGPAQMRDRPPLLPALAVLPHVCKLECTSELLTTLLVPWFVFQCRVEQKKNPLRAALNGNAWVYLCAQTCPWRMCLAPAVAMSALALE